MISHNNQKAEPAPTVSMRFVSNRVHHVEDDKDIIIAQVTRNSPPLLRPPNVDQPWMYPTDVTSKKRSQSNKKILLERGADVPPMGENGKTPLIDTSLRGHLDVVKLLIGSGAALNDKDNKGNAALH
ncbi:26S proteasome non-ATPase regulatory subunit 10-like [Halyomorpha halys]|uniref:26S proteasome non-ATPase regulatory subunit 10-like n=1 Tax=Halyomorpha halys TaxID=286706 RepID=UPI0034D17F97